MIFTIHDKIHNKIQIPDKTHDETPNGAMFVSASIDSLGAQLISLKDASGREHIWQRDPAIWGFCSPLLFPAIGNSRNNRTKFDGEWYELAKHGFCRTSEFEAEQISDSEVRFTLCANEETRIHYPYEFVLTLTYRLENGTLSMTYQVENPMNRKICYCIGAHPGFLCPMEDGTVFEDYQLEFEKKESISSVLYDLEKLEFDPSRHGTITLENESVIPLCYDLFDLDAVYFEKTASHVVRLINRNSGHGVEVAYPDFGGIGFWTPNGKHAPFLCIEPWNGCAIRMDEDDEFIHKYQVQKLDAHTARSYQMRIRMV